MRSLRLCCSQLVPGCGYSELQLCSDIIVIADVVRHVPNRASSKARSMPHQQFKEEVEKYLTGSSEASELIYFKLYKRQIPIIEQALEIAARMLGSDKSRGYWLETICADFLAGVQVENGSPDSLLSVVLRLVGLLPSEQKQAFTEKLAAVA
jgi:hypothetical protein